VVVSLHWPQQESQGTKKEDTSFTHLQPRLSRHKDPSHCWQKKATKSKVFAPVSDTAFLVGGSGGACPFPVAPNVPPHSSTQTARMPLLWATVPPPLLMKGLHLIQGLWEGRGEDSLKPSHHHPGPRMGHALPPSEGSTVPQAGHGRHQGCLCTGGLCFSSDRSGHVSTSTLADCPHLNPVSLPNLGQCQHRCAGRQTAETEELCSLRYSGERK